MNTRTTFAWLFVLLYQFKCFGVCEREENNFIGDDQVFIDSLREYEFVEPLVSSSLSTGVNIARQVNEIERSISFSFRGKKLTLKLSLNRNLFSKNYFERDIIGNESQVTRKNSHFCFFHGHIEGHKDESVVAVSTCDGINGYFTLLRKTYLIQPVTSVKGNVFHVVFEAEDNNLPRFECGHNRSEVFKMDFPEARHRVRRDVLSETKYLEMVIVNDVSQYQRHKNATTLRAKTLANIVDSVYRAHKIRVVLIMIETWQTVNKIRVVPNEQTTLDNFENYKKDVLDKDTSTKNDNAQLLTRQTFSGSIVGKASMLSICSPTSSSIIRDHSDNVALVASTMAHELGHNFGLNHDEAVIDGNCECGVPDGCVMAGQLRYIPLLKLSNCSLATLKKTLLSDYGTCLFDQPARNLRHAECGNAFIDEGEECDCGTKEECKLAGNLCCNHTTCQFTPYSKCSDAPCCHNCQIKSNGSLCRETVNDCDLPEYCDGKLSICVPDSYVHNGRPCGDDKKGKGLCYIGVCHTHDEQCKDFWGPIGKKAHRYCYRYLNTLADKFGHCKKLPGGLPYMKCKIEDMYCGKLQCEKDPPTDMSLPIIGTSRQAHYKFVDKYKCWSGVVYMGDDIPEPGMVQTGTMCGENKVCSNNTCIDVDVAYKQPNCANNCSGNGICNNLGHCHCNYGYKCPDCIEACSGEGGSVDSGNGCGCSEPDINSTVSTAFTTNIPSTTEDIKSTISTAFTTNIPSTTQEPGANSTVSTEFTTNVPSTTEGTTTLAKSTAPTSKHSTSTSPTITRPTDVKTDTEGPTTLAKSTAPTFKQSTSTSPTITRPTYVKTDIEVTTDEPHVTTKSSTTEIGSTTKRIPGADGESSRNQKVTDVPTVVIVVIVLVSVLFFIGVLLCYCYRDLIGAKFRNVRESSEKPFPSVSFNRDRYRSESSQQHLTIDGSRSVQIEIGPPMPSVVDVVTPDRSKDKKSIRFSTIPSIPVYKESKPVPSVPEKPKLSPHRRPIPDRPRIPDRAATTDRRPPVSQLGPKIQSLPDLVGAFRHRPLAGVSLENKSQSFSQLDKAICLKHPSVSRLLSRQTSNAELGAKVHAGPSQHPLSTPDIKPGTNLSADPFKRTHLRNTPAIPKTPPNTSRRPGDNRSTVEHTFQPSDLKEAKSPFTAA